MSDNVFIFGAGISSEAGIPLMNNFVETMWELSLRDSFRGTEISKEDKKLFQQAIDVKNSLDSYHGRAKFNDRDIEAILSILSFEQLRDGTSKSLEIFTEAIARTIELTCMVNYPSIHSSETLYFHEDSFKYREFWENVINSSNRNPETLPSIITFNYDLVLERSLCQYITNTDPNDLYFDILEIDYHFDSYKNYGLLKNSSLIFTAPSEGRPQPIQLNHAGTRLSQINVSYQGYEKKVVLKANILKLHGSVNFPYENPSNDIVLPVNNPLLLPPIFNKMDNSQKLEDVWRVAINKLRNAKNIFIVGYSLPSTDIYMQYFLKTALGPNLNLNRIYVFDPALSPHKKSHTEKANAMKKRYYDCFSSEIHDRIVFNHKSDGYFRSFVESFQELLF